MNEIFHFLLNNLNFNINNIDISTSSKKIYFNVTIHHITIGTAIQFDRYVDSKNQWVKANGS